MRSGHFKLVAEVVVALNVIPHALLNLGLLVFAAAYYGELRRVHHEIPLNGAAAVA
jgi:hypothetical protein